jgi:hypothetical protein
VFSVYLGALAPDGTQLLAHRRLTLDENENDPFAWTRDGKAVLFSSDRNGTSAIFKQVTDQPLAEGLMTSAAQLKQPRVTPDGSEILYISTPKSARLETPSSLFAIPIGGGVPRLVLNDVGIWNVQCANAPLNFCLYSVAKGNDMETFRFDVKNGKSSDPSQVDPLCNWSLSPDGSQQFQKILDMDPKFVPAQHAIEAAYFQNAMYGEAIGERQKVLTLSGNPDLAAAIGEDYIKSGYLGVMRSWMEGLQEISKHGYVSQYNMARLHAVFEDKEQAITGLEQAFRERDCNLTYMKVEPAFDEIRSDPRFQQLLHQFGWAE